MKGQYWSYFDNLGHRNNLEIYESADKKIINPFHAKHYIYFIYTYIHAYIHTYIHTYIHAYIYIIYIYIYLYMHIYIWCMYLCININVFR